MGRERRALGEYSLAYTRMRRDASARRTFVARLFLEPAGRADRLPLVAGLAVQHRVAVVEPARVEVAEVEVHRDEPFGAERVLHHHAPLSPFGQVRLRAESRI